MRVIISIFHGRISPVFDVARNLLVVEVEQGKEKNRWHVKIEETEIISRVKRIAENSVDILICGAISRTLENMLTSVGIAVIPQTCGAVEDVLEAFLSGELKDQSFLMPGCCCRRRCLQNQYHLIKNNKRRE